MDHREPPCFHPWPLLEMARRFEKGEGGRPALKRPQKVRQYFKAAPHEAARCALCGAAINMRRRVILPVRAEPAERPQYAAGLEEH